MTKETIEKIIRNNRVGIAAHQIYTLMTKAIAEREKERALIERMETAAKTDAKDLETPRDGTKLNRHGLVMLIAYLQEDIAERDRQLAEVEIALGDSTPKVDGLNIPIPLTRRVYNLGVQLADSQRNRDEWMNAATEAKRAWEDSQRQKAKLEGMVNRVMEAIYSGWPRVAENILNEILQSLRSTQTEEKK